MITMENDAVRDEEDAQAAYENIMKDSNKFVITATQDSACFSVPFSFAFRTGRLFRRLSSLVRKTYTFQKMRFTLFMSR